MMRSVVSCWSLRYRLLMLGISGAIILFGATQLRNASVTAVPEFAPTYVEVQTEALGLSADEVEQLITVPLEADLLNGVAWLDDDPLAVGGRAVLDRDGLRARDRLFRARQVVAERLTQAHALPHVSKPPTMLQPLSSTSRRDDDRARPPRTLPLIEHVRARPWTIRPRLMGVPGVANVAIWGQRDRQLQVLVDPSKLRAQRRDAPPGRSRRPATRCGSRRSRSWRPRPRDRRVHRHAQPAARRPAHLRRSGRPSDLASIASRSTTPDGPPAAR